MEPIRPPAAPPVGGILDRYLMSGFIRIFALSLLCSTLLYLIVDFFDRIDNLLKAGASLESSVRYFLYKLPLSVSRVFGIATLFSALFSLGALSRTQEITAMRAGGLNLRRLALPLVSLSLLIGLLTFFWNETLVPIFTRKSQYIYKVEVKKMQPKSVIGTKDIWIRGDGTFISADYFDTRRNLLEGVVIYLLDSDFSLKGVIEAPWARWNGSHWETRGAKEWLFLPEGQLFQRPAPTLLPFSETPEDLKIFAREPEEMSFFDLKKQIEDLKTKGIDTSEYQVDLQVKLALPLIPPLMVLLAFPFALRHRPKSGMALSFGLTTLIGFVYWVLLAFSISLGHSGALPPWVAAWFPNLVLGLTGLFLFFNAE